MVCANGRREIKTEVMDKEIFVTKSSMPDYEEYIEAIKPLWDTHWLTNMGTYHRQLESLLRDYLKVSDVSLTVNGHMALEFRHLISQRILR